MKVIKNSPNKLFHHFIFEIHSLSYHTNKYVLSIISIGFKKPFSFEKLKKGGPLRCSKCPCRNDREMHVTSTKIDYQFILRFFNGL